MVNTIGATIVSKAEAQLYLFPKGMRKITGVRVGERKLPYSTTFTGGAKNIVLLEPLGMDGIKIEVRGVK